jgi:uncharacterized C2H2 Zn-finger protein
MTKHHIKTSPAFLKNNTYILKNNTYNQGESETESIITKGHKVAIRCPTCNTLHQIQPDKLDHINSNEITHIGMVKQASPVINEYKWIITNPSEIVIKQPYCSQKCLVTDNL